MRWEFLERQKLHDSAEPGKGYAYSIAMWRSPVPGGWLIMSLNSKSNDPQPMVSYYADPEHVWKGNEPPESEYLLRPASAGAITPQDRLLRPADAESSGPG